MKSSGIIFLVSLLLISANTFSQGVDGVLIDPNNATTRDASAVFQAQSTSQGIMIPRMTAAQRAAISVSAARDGLIVYQTDAPAGFYYYNGATLAWVLIANTTSNLAGVTAGTGLTGGGTSGTITVNAVGDNGLTTNADDIDLGGPLTQAATTITQDGSETFTIANTGTGNTTINLSSTGDFDVQDNGTSALFVRDDAFVGVGTNAPNSPFTVRTTVATANARTTSLANAIGDVNFEMVTSKGAITNASGDITTQIGQAYNGGTITEGIRFIRGGGSTDGSMAFVTNSGTERMRIASNGNVGIGSNAPGVPLDVVGNLRGSNMVSLTSGNGKGYRFWDSDSYKIHMGSAAEYFYGPVTDYSIKMNMSNTAGRGWTWGVAGATPIAALNTAGAMQVNSTFTAVSNITNGGFDFLLGNTDQVSRGNSGSSRALVKEPGSILTLNYAGDFTGGTRIGSLAGTGSRIVVADANGTLSATTSVGSGMVTGSGTQNYVTKWNNAAGTTIGNSQIYDNGTNVGIGSATPNQKLDVVGAIRSTDYHYINNNNPSIIFQDTDQRSGVIHVNSNLMYFLSGSGVNGTGWTQNGSYWPLHINMTNDEATFGGAAYFMEGNVGIGLNGPQSLLHVMGKTNIHQSGAGGGQNRFEGLEAATSANGRAQLVLSSAYSDLVIASSQGNDNHGSTLTFASYNPSNAADYRKFVINQGNWGARFGYLDFGFADAGGRTNPHSNINGTDNVITLNGINKRLGVATMSPTQTLDVNGKTRIRRGVNTMGGNANEGQLEIANTGSGDAYISFHREGVWGAQFGLESDNWFTTKGWSPGGGGWNSLRVGNLDIRGVVNCIGGYCPPNNAVRLTPNLHLNSNAGNAVILNWDNGTTGATQTLRVGNGASSDVFYVYADGQCFTTNWFRPLGSSGLYFQDYGGGWHMTDGTWIRSYNSKNVYINTVMRADGGVYAADNVRMRSAGNNEYGSTQSFSSYGVTIEQGISESGGFHADGDETDIWSPGDGNLLNVWDEDGMVLEAYLNATGAYVNASDINKKQNIVKVDNALAKVLSLSGYNYEFKLHPDEIAKGQTPSMTAGVIAQEVKEVMPELVYEIEGQGLFMAYDGLLPYLIEAIKEQQTEIEQMKDRTITASDFGSESISGNEKWVEFSEEFITKNTNGHNPIVTVTPFGQDINLRITETTLTGFRVVSNKQISEASFNWIAMIKVNRVSSVQRDVESEKLKREIVDEMNLKLAKHFKEHKEKTSEEAQKKMELSKNAMELPEDFQRPENSGKHDDKANDANALIKESAKQVELNAPQYSPNRDEILNK